MKVAFERKTDHRITIASSYQSLRKILAGDPIFDLIVLDYDMPGQDGVNAISEVVGMSRRVPVAIFSGAIPEHVEAKLVECGISGFMKKDKALQSLFSFVDFLLAGEKYFPPDYISRRNKRNSIISCEKLQLVLDGICDGLTYKEIGEMHSLPTDLVKNYARQVIKVIKARNRTHAAVIALKKGLRS